MRDGQDLNDVREVHLDGTGRTDDAQVPGRLGRPQSAEMPNTTGQLDPILELTGETGDVPPLDADQAGGIGVEAQARVLDGLDLAEVGAAVIKRNHVGLAVFGQHGCGGDDQHEAGYTRTHY